MGRWIWGGAGLQVSAPMVSMCIPSGRTPPKWSRTCFTWTPYSRNDQSSLWRQDVRLTLYTAVEIAPSAHGLPITLQHSCFPTCTIDTHALSNSIKPPTSVHLLQSPPKADSPSPSPGYNAICSTLRVPLHCNVTVISSCGNLLGSIKSLNKRSPGDLTSPPIWIA
jgi:hypothetical protein